MMESDRNIYSGEYKISTVFRMLSHGARVVATDMRAYLNERGYDYVRPVRW